MASSHMWLPYWGHRWFTGCFIYFDQKEIDSKQSKFSMVKMNWTQRTSGLVTTLMSLLFYVYLFFCRSHFVSCWREVWRSDNQGKRTTLENEWDFEPLFCYNQLFLLIRDVKIQFAFSLKHKNLLLTGKLFCFFNSFLERIISN